MSQQRKSKEAAAKLKGSTLKADVYSGDALGANSPAEKKQKKKEEARLKAESDKDWFKKALEAKEKGEPIVSRDGDETNKKDTTTSTSTTTSTTITPGENPMASIISQISQGKKESQANDEDDEEGSDYSDSEEDDDGEAERKRLEAEKKAKAAKMAKMDALFGKKLQGK